MPPIVPVYGSERPLHAFPDQAKRTALGEKNRTHPTSYAPTEQNNRMATTVTPAPRITDSTRECFGAAPAVAATPSLEKGTQRHAPPPTPLRFSCMRTEGIPEEVEEGGARLSAAQGNHGGTPTRVLGNACLSCREPLNPSSDRTVGSKHRPRGLREGATELRRSSRGGARWASTPELPRGRPCGVGRRSSSSRGGAQPRMIAGERTPASLSWVLERAPGIRPHETHGRARIFLEVFRDASVAGVRGSLAPAWTSRQG